MSLHTFAYDFQRFVRNSKGITHPRGRYQIYTPTDPSAALSENPGRKTEPPLATNPRKRTRGTKHISARWKLTGWWLGVEGWG